MFSGTTIVALAALGRLDDLVRLPAEFAPLAHALRSVLPAPRAPEAAFLAALMLAIATGAGIGALLGRRLGRVSTLPALGNIAALLPRNRSESLQVALLAANAGLGEECFFRLLLPLAVTLLTGNAPFAFTLAALAFGMAHAYQGWVGMTANTCFGLALTALYLSTGSLWLAVAVHVLINVAGLLVRPLMGTPIPAAAVDSR